jgi:hypothetical protein
MKESFDQQDGQSPTPSTGSRQDGHNGGSAASSAALHAARRPGRIHPAPGAGSPPVTLFDGKPAR